MPKFSSLMKVAASKAGELNQKINLLSDQIDNEHREIREEEELDILEEGQACSCGSRNLVAHCTGGRRVARVMLGVMDAGLIQKNRYRCQSCGKEYKREWSMDRFNNAQR